jgi:hypothetical protein
MRSQGFYKVFCLILIQFSMLMGCRQGHQSKNSTASTLDKNVYTEDIAKKNPGVIEIKNVSTNSFDRRKGQLTANSKYTQSEGNEVDLLGKPCSVDMRESGDSLSLDVKLGDISELLPLTKDQLEKYFIKQEVIENNLNFRYFIESTSTLVLGSVVNFKDTGLQEEGILFQREIYAFKDTEIKNVTQALQWLTDNSEKMKTDKAFQDIRLNQDFYKFVLKNKKLSEIRYLSRFYKMGTATSSSGHSLEKGTYQELAKLICPLND